MIRRDDQIISNATHRKKGGAIAPPLKKVASKKAD
jgi:hypothetical protein